MTVNEGFRSRTKLRIHPLEHQRGVGTAKAKGIRKHGSDPVFADMPIVRKRIDNARLGTVLSNSFGFGGTNATLVFKRMDA